ncbi:MAG: Helix-hairpin-helix motif [Acidobacteriales bacterium]|nr:Helix-hairpin-helix motif [Terriglobales bacterium]
MKKALIFLGMVGVGAFLTSAYLARQRETSVGSAPFDLLDLNHASEQDLIARCGIDADLASRILENRPYATKIDLIGRRVIPDANYEAIKHLVTVAHVA